MEMDPPLHAAPEYGDVEAAVRRLMEEGADVEASALAAQEGDLVEVVRVLVDAGAHVEAELVGGERPLYLAAQERGTWRWWERCCRLGQTRGGCGR